ncbi:hypothetical protein CYY_000582 [Polysphondylium violaceum]|uniref:Peptide transporter n=1 Tax=Polysphondylium violaceum TaxID=133409 RepID=A0A8J4Q1J3_9MYCE|nr:hypothetical protein CYY_000582 [Polysphondylium violaceum]
MGMDEDGILAKPRLIAGDATPISLEKTSVSLEKQFDQKLNSSLEIPNGSHPTVYDEDGNEIKYGGDEKHFPPSIKFIMGNEIIERYSFYGLKSILNNYMIHYMGYTDTTAASIYHGFNAGAYFTTLLGAYLADGKLGKYKTILYFSIIYCIGGVFLAISAIPGVTGPEPGNRSPWGLILGLLLIALGTGGIKPVISAFCGDQFGPHQAKLLANIFQVFYWCVNLGSAFSTIITPIVRTNLGYWVAFLIPSCLLVVSISVFVFGNKTYIKKKPTGSVLLTSARIIKTGISEKIKSKKPDYDDQLYQGHWLDRSKGKFDPITVDQMKNVLKVLLIFLPLPIFWALYDQGGSIWIDQANLMDRKIGSVTIDSEILTALNPILIMIFVPIFEYCLYRPLAKKGVNFSPLRRMSVGMFLTFVSFMVSMFVQFAIDAKPPGTVNIGLQIPQIVIMAFAEILISITGLEFAYSQSPPQMKSLIMSMWLITVSIGNLFDTFVIALIKLTFWQSYLFFSCCMFGFFVLFVFISLKYKPIEINYNDPITHPNSNHTAGDDDYQNGEGKDQQIYDQIQQQQDHDDYNKTRNIPDNESDHSSSSRGSGHSEGYQSIAEKNKDQEELQKEIDELSSNSDESTSPIFKSVPLNKD